MIYQISPFAEFNRDKIVNKATNYISSKGLIIFNGNLDQDDDHFFVKGKLNENYKIDNKFNLTVYSNTSYQINISCETTNENFNNFEVQCEKVRSTNFNINNSISYMNSKQLLIIIEDGETDLVEGKNIIYNKYINNKENSSISSGAIAAIIIAIVGVCILTGLIIIFRKKIFQIKKERNCSTENFQNLDVSMPK